MYGVCICRVYFSWLYVGSPSARSNTHHDVFLLSWLFFFQRPRDFGEINKTRTSTSSKLCTAYDTCVALPEGARDSLYSSGLLPLSRSVVDASAKARCIARFPASFGFSDRNVNFKTQQQRPPCVFYCCRATLSNRSVVPQKFLPNSKV